MRPLEPVPSPPARRPGDLTRSPDGHVATPRGRPTLYRPGLCDRARRHLEQGATLAQLAGLLGVSPRSVDNWVARIPAFAAAVRKGRAEAGAALDRLLYQRAIGYTRTVERVVRCRGRVEIVRYSKHHAPDARACMRFLCRRAPQDWRRRPDLPPRRPADESGVNRAHLIDREVVEVVNNLHAIGMGYVLPVERVVVWFGEPRVLRYTRQLRPHTRAGMFWLCNRLPEQWCYRPANRVPASLSNPLPLRGRVGRAPRTVVDFSHLKLEAARPRRAPSLPCPRTGEQHDGRGVNRAHKFPRGPVMVANGSWALEARPVAWPLAGRRVSAPMIRARAPPAFAAACSGAGERYGRSATERIIHVRQ